MAKSKSQQNINPAEELVNDKDFKRYVQMGIGAVVAAVLIAVGIGYYQNQQAEKTSQEAEWVYTFENESLKSFTEDKIQADELLSKASETATKLSDTALFLPSSSEIYTEFSKKDVNTAKLIPLFETLRKGTGKTNLAYYNFSQYLAVFYENNKQYPEAIAVFKELLNSNYKYEEKLYLDLGRLHYLNGEKDLAKTNFNHVIDKFPDSQFGKMAKIYLTKYGLASALETEEKVDANKDS